ncbi:MAG: hypothetical protein DMF63_13485 [Acidobacteria bacterium]|nr:MAG: hypothetical protein DMF63_13485 [Acidobacteriota bacterium]
MDEIVSKYDISKRDLARGRNLKVAAVSAPLVLAGVPAALFLILMFVFGATPPVAATFFFIGLILTIIGFVVGLGMTGFFAYRHANWTKEMRERIAADGIKAEEIEWFRNELKTAEKRALREMQRDPMLEDAYRETLASRLTATRIVRSSKKELFLAKRRQTKLRQLKKLNRESSEKFKAEIDSDIEKISTINDEAKLMLAEAESRLQLIEAAAARGSHLADSELALKKLSARAAELPLALEEARMTEEIRKEIEAEDGEEEGERKTA